MVTGDCLHPQHTVVTQLLRCTLFNVLGDILRVFIFLAYLGIVLVDLNSLGATRAASVWV